MRELFDLFVNEGATKLEALPTVCAQGDLKSSAEKHTSYLRVSLGPIRLAAFYRAIERAVDEQN